MSDDPLVPLTLVLGEEELLVARAIARVVDAARAAEPAGAVGSSGMDVRELASRDVALGDLLDLLSPSLFGDRRVVVLRDAQDLDRSVADAVGSYAADPVGEVSLVVAHAGGAKGKALVSTLREASARVVDCPRITKPGERLSFVREELRSTGRRVAEPAVRALTEAVGSDLRELANACNQLLADTEGDIDTDMVARYHRGRADVTGFVVADKAVEGDAAGALESLRWALAVGVAPVLVSSALASGLRALARVSGDARGHPGALAKSLGMPPWKVERAQRQLRGWTPAGLARAVHAVARADAEVKGAGSDPGYALERAVLAVVAARR